MTATADQKTALVGLLINSCHRAEKSYRWAAGTMTDERLKRLFELYAQQRTRFADELRDYLPAGTADHLCEGAAELHLGAARTVQESIRECLEMDARTLALYRETVARRMLPTRAHFVISSQLALMQQAHDRMQQTLIDSRASARPGWQTHRLSA